MAHFVANKEQFLLYSRLIHVMDYVVVTSNMYGMMSQMVTSHLVDLTFDRIVFFVGFILWTILFASHLTKNMP